MCPNRHHLERRCCETIHCMNSLMFNWETPVQVIFVLHLEYVTNVTLNAVFSNFVHILHRSFHRTDEDAEEYEHVSLTA